MDLAAPAEVLPRPASTVIALRRAGESFEVLMVRRALEARFMPGARVFPGGAVEPSDGSATAAAMVRWSGDASELPWRVAALRELAEEVGIVVTTEGAKVDSGGDLFVDLAAAGARLDADALRFVGHWVTPRGLPVRFDTRFFLVEVAADVAVRSDQTEVHEPVWVAPQTALTAADAGDWQVEVPTRAHLEMLAAAPGLGALLAGVAGPPPRIEPRIAPDDQGGWRVLLPGDRGYDDA